MEEEKKAVYAKFLIKSDVCIFMADLNLFKNIKYPKLCSSRNQFFHINGLNLF